KIALFGGLLVLGARNFLLVRRLHAHGAPPISRLRHFAEAEMGIGITVMLAAASLTTTPPAVDVIAERASLTAIGARMPPRWPRLTSPEVAALSPLTLQSNANGSEPSGSLGPPPSTAADIAWSESNHHWSGLIVLAAGGLACAWRTGRARWASH